MCIKIFMFFQTKNDREQIKYYLLNKFDIGNIITLACQKFHKVYRLHMADYSPSPAGKL